MKKTKILVPAMAVLALGTIASVTGTVAWYSVQASTTISFGATIQAPSSILAVSGFNPFGYSIDTSGSTNVANLAVANTATLTDVTSSDGKVFTKYGLVDGEVAPSPAPADTYIVSRNAYFVPAAQNDANTNWATPAPDATTKGVPSSTNNKLQLNGVKSGTIAYARFGFQLTNLSENTITITTLINKVNATVTASSGDPVDAVKLAIGPVSDATYASIPTVSPKACGTDGLDVATGFSFVSSLNGSSSQKYVVTIWVDGAVAGMNNETVASANAQLTLKFGAVEA